MNPTIERLTRAALKANLAKLPENQFVTFKLMYAHKNPEYTIEQAVDHMDAKQLDWAMTQVDNSLKKLGLYEE